MKELYLDAELEVIEFSIDDIITTSADATIPSTELGDVPTDPDDGPTDPNPPPGWN